MTELVRFERYGGPRPPTDDELLVVDDDGTFALRRTVTTGRAGSFAGRLPNGELASLRDELRTAAAAPAASAPTPEGGVFERAAWSDGSVSVHEGWAPPDGWQVVSRLRALCESGTEHPVAALQAELAPDGASVRLEVVGGAELEVDLHNAEVDVEAVGWPNVALGRWAGTGAELLPDEPEPTWELAPDGPRAAGLGRAPGWSVVVPLPHGLAVADAHEVRAELRIWLAADGTGRTARFVLRSVRPSDAQEGER